MVKMAVRQKEYFMKLFGSLALLAVISLLQTACVSRTTTVEKGFENEVTEKKLIWIWQDEFYNSK